MPNCVCMFKGVFVDFASSKPRSRINYSRLRIKVLELTCVHPHNMLFSNRSELGRNFSLKGKTGKEGVITWELQLKKLKIILIQYFVACFLTILYETLDQG